MLLLFQKRTLINCESNEIDYRPLPHNVLDNWDSGSAKYCIITRETP